MKFTLKIGSFFCMVIMGYKMKTTGIIEDFKKRRKKFLIKKIVKIYLRISLELLWAVWVQLSFRQLLVPA